MTDNLYIAACAIGNPVRTQVYTEPCYAETAIARARALASSAAGLVAFVYLYDREARVPALHVLQIGQMPHLRYDASSVDGLSCEVKMTVLRGRPDDLYEACLLDEKRILREQQNLDALLAIVTPFDAPPTIVTES